MTKNQTKNRIRNLLAAHAALTYLHHASGDDRGLALAGKYDREAHQLAVSYGLADRPTWELAVLTAE